MFSNKLKTVRTPEDSRLHIEYSPKNETVVKVKTSKS